MKVRYLNGEKVYVYDYSESDIRIWRHRDLVRAINRVFKEVERSPDVPSAGAFSLGDALYGLCNALPDSRVPVKHVNGYDEKIIYDGDIRNKKDKTFFERMEDIENGIQRIEAGIKEVEEHEIEAEKPRHLTVVN